VTGSKPSRELSADFGQQTSGAELFCCRCFLVDC
jgi:hypothetical protein